MSDLWMTPSYRTRTWPYKGTPEPGDTIRYMNDGYDSTVQHIRRTRIVMNDGTIYRRRIDWDKLYAWIASHRLKISESSLQPVEYATVQPRPLRPTIHHVAKVSL